MIPLRILAFGDVIGRVGRRIIEEHGLPMRDQLSPDVFLINGENIAGGFGLTRKLVRTAFSDWGVSVITTGNHWHDKPEIHAVLHEYPRLLLPANMSNVSDPARGCCVLPTARGNVAVINLLGRTFMRGEHRCPFMTFDQLFDQVCVAGAQAVIVDFHAEATSEKQALATYVAKRASLIFGTHTHCPTADTRIIDEFTGYQTDLGMTGGYASVIGMTPESSLPGFLGQKRKPYAPAGNEPWLCGIVSEIEPKTGRCIRLERVQKRLTSV